MMTLVERQARAEARKAQRIEAKRLARVAAQKAQKPVASITITLEWRKSRMYGHCPHGTAEVRFLDGTYTRKEGYRAGGCGYDKASTVVGEAFTDFLAYKIHQKPPIDGKPYGICLTSGGTGYYSYGIGMSCYPAIGEWIGGQFETIASGNTFDVYRWTDNAARD